MLCLGHITKCLTAITLQGELEPVKAIAGQEKSNKSLPPLLSVSLSSDTVNSHTSKPRFPERSMTLVQEKPIAPSIQSSSSFMGYRGLNGKSKNQIGLNDWDLDKEDKAGRVPQNITSSSQPSEERKISEPKPTLFDDEYLHLTGGDEESVDKSLIESIKRQATMRNGISTRKGVGAQINNGRLKHVKSELPDTSGKNGFFGRSYNAEKATKIHGIDAAGASVKSSQLKKEIAVESSDRKARTTAETERNKMLSEFPDKVHALEDELREAATLEVALYSVVAEHGSSANKVHAPARRLSRFYLHACKENSTVKQASAARAAISGLLLVSKACGNDVPRYVGFINGILMKNRS